MEQLSITSNNESTATTSNNVDVDVNVDVRNADMSGMERLAALGRAFVPEEEAIEDGNTTTTNTTANAPISGEARLALLTGSF